MANPTRGIRIPVKLPWKGATDKEDQFVSMKSTVAKYLKFDNATKDELEYEVTIQKKGDDKGKTTVKRRRSPGYRQRSVKLTFQVGSGVGKTIGTKATIGGGSYASIQFPITTSVSISDVVNYFESGAGKGLKVLKVTDVNTGKGHNLITS